MNGDDGAIAPEASRSRPRRMPSGHVVVTGAAGFIGSHLSIRLRKEGHRVVGVDAHRGTTTPRVAAHRLSELAGDAGFDLVELDLVTADLRRVLMRAEAVFHLAGRPGARDGDARAFARDNVDATARLVGGSARAGVGHVVLASSSSVYGDAGRERASRETDPVRPLSPYGRSKRAAELVCLSAGVRSTVVRLFTVYGPGQRSDMAFERFITACVTGVPAPLYQAGPVTRDFTYVDDAVEGTLRAWTRGTAPIYNVSGGRAIRLAAACAIIEELTGRDIATRAAPAPDQPSSTRADLSLARSHLGYRPSVGLREGLAAQIAENGVRSAALLPPLQRAR